MIVCFTLLLSSCSTEGKESDFYAALEEKLSKTTDHQNKLFENISKESIYSYTISLNEEMLSNFDSANRLLPENFNEAENKKMKRCSFSYTYTQVDADYYVIAKLTQSKLDSNGYPLFKDDSYQENIYDDTYTLEYKSSSNKIVVKKGDESIYDEIYNYMSEEIPDEIMMFDVFVDLENFSMLTYLVEECKTSKDSVFSANYVNWFGSVISSHTNYAVKDYSNTAYTPYRKSSQISGYGEDLLFDWENIDLVESRTVSITSVKDKISQVEMYLDVFAANQKTTVQIWNNEETTVWQGDLIGSTKLIVNFKYEDSKNKITIP